MALLRILVLSLMLLSLTSFAVVVNPDGSATLTEEEGIALMAGINKLENDRDYWQRIARDLKEQLRVEKTKRCI